MELVEKRRAGAPRGFFAAEAAGLRWLRVDGGAQVVRVRQVDGESISVERVYPGTPTREVAARFGAELTVTHDAGAAGFGARPEGYDGDCFIGDAELPMPTTPLPNWGEFYARYRVLPYVEQAAQRRLIRNTAPFERVAERLINGEFDDAAPPARIHGDLWAGNVLFTAAAAVLIDPAAHGGHRVTDLAMLALFGCPHLETIYAAYEANSAHLPADWRSLIKLHQIHPLLVHVVLFGSGYTSQAEAAVKPYL
ncbi:MAG: fructosamine kinase family protein [Propionibacteriaceae bacterium]|jgi:fructosamine-3-kinase|nr:fructosamine kinase family protein [Propionibacteriaceae bacterium]